MENLTPDKKRLLMRAEHRGIKEMDIILGGYVKMHLESFSKDDVDLIEEFMKENDQKLYQMILGNEIVPQQFAMLVANLRSHVKI